MNSLQPLRTRCVPILHQGLGGCLLVLLGMTLTGCRRKPAAPQPVAIPPRLKAGFDRVRHPGLYDLDAEVHRLGNLSDPTWIPALVQALEDPHPSVRNLAAMALCRIHAPQTLDPLLRVLARRLQGDETAWIVAGNLHQFEDARILTPLREALDAQDPRVAHAAGRSLLVLHRSGRAGDAERLALIRSLAEASRREPNANHRENFILLLGELQDEACLVPLAQILQQDPHPTCRINAAIGLTRLQDPRVPGALQAALTQEGDPHVRSWLESSLNRYSNP